MKYCSKCKETKPLDLFNKNKNTKDGLHCYCRICQNALTKHYHKIQRSTDEGRKKHNQTTLAWQRSYPEKVNKKNAKWAKKNPEKVIAKTRKHQAKKLMAVPIWFEKEKVDLLYQKAQQWGFEVDHVIPLQGKNVCGLHCWANLQLLDRSTNASKSNIDYPDH